MKARPILFSPEMVRALLEERKTQTRRPIGRELKHPGWTGYSYFGPSKNNPTCESMAIENGPDYPDSDEDVVRCPYGAVGDRLWVRENWCVGSKWNATRPGALPARGLTVMFQAGGSMGGNERGKYLPDETYPAADDLPEWAGKLRPSIYLPRWASRITLTITEIRVQQLQEISTEDAIAEGWPIGGGVPIFWYRNLWEQLNGFGSWAKNPWCWALTFTVSKSNVETITE